MLIFSILGTTATLFLCGVSVVFSFLFFLLLSRFLGGLMAGNMTIAYAALADFSSPEEKVKNFALIPLASGLGFVLGPYAAAILGNSETHSFAGPALPFFFAGMLSFVSLFLIVWKFPSSFVPKPQGTTYFSSLAILINAFKKTESHLYFGLLFFMVSSNFLFVQFIGPLVIERFGIGVTGIGYLYANIGISVAFGHLFLTRRLANFCTSEKALKWSLSFLAFQLFLVLFCTQLIVIHLLTFGIMLACAVGYTNSMALVSNQGTIEKQGETMGVAVAIQSCSEFLPAAIFGFAASFSQTTPMNLSH